MNLINAFYIFFLGIILSITAGFGVAAFYPQPLQPIYPTTYNALNTQNCYQLPQGQLSSECQKLIAKQKQMWAQYDLERQKYEKDLKIYKNKNAEYNRTSIFFGIVFGGIFAILGIGIIKKSKLVANGLLLGGILTALFTRFLIPLASLGESTPTIAGIDLFIYVEFFVLLILSVFVVFLGFTNLKDQTISTK